MKQKDFTGIIPAQYTGNEIEAQASVDLKDDNEAKIFYEVVKERLLNVNNWHKVAGIICAKFQLIDANGKEIERSAKKGDYLKIDKPGPGGSEGDGFDWVCVEDVKEVTDVVIQSIGFRVRPSQNPLGEKNETAHFYSNEATCNFIVIRESTKISSWTVDRNIKSNKHADSLTDKIRDSAVGIGAIGLFSKAQWQGLAKGLVEKKN